MRILFVNERGAYFGGVEQHVAHAAAEMRDRGHVCLLACGRADGTDAAGFRALFHQTYEIPDLDSRATIDRDPQWLARLCASAAVDVAYLHKLPTLPDLAPMRDEVRVVQMVHDHDICCPRRHKYFALSARPCDKPAGLRCLLDGAFLERDATATLGVRVKNLIAHRREMRRHWDVDALLVGSRWMRDEVLMNGAPDDRVHLVPPAVPGAPVASSVEPTPGEVLYVGQLVRGKGVDRLLRAMATVTTPWRLVLAGRGNQEAELRALAGTLRIADRVTFAGWVAPAKLGRFYQQASVVVVPSRWPEPFGMVGLEAMRHGRPVVAFRVGGIPDWLVDGVNGHLVADGDIAAFGHAVQALLAQPATAAALGREGRRLVATRFDFPGCMDTLERHLTGRLASARSIA